MIFKAGKLGEIIKGVGVDRKEEGLRTEPRAGSNSLLPKSLLQLPRLIHRKPVSPIYWSSSCFIKPRHDLPVGTNSKMTNARKAWELQPQVFKRWTYFGGRESTDWITNDDGKEGTAWKEKDTLENTMLKEKCWFQGPLSFKGLVFISFWLIQLFIFFRIRISAIGAVLFMECPWAIAVLELKLKYSTVHIFFCLVCCEVWFAECDGEHLPQAGKLYG